MYLFAELWSARPEWLALSVAEREKYLARVGRAMEGLLRSGFELLGVAVNDPDTPHRAGYRYLAVWEAPDRKLALEFEETIEQLGWYRYFDQDNIRGHLVPAEATFRDMVAL